MEQRAIGQTGLQTSAIGLGCWGMSGSYGPSDDAEATRTIDRALELGITFFDTADTYGAGHNEEFVGGVLRGRRDKITIATKFGRQVGGEPGALVFNGKPDYVRSACDASLRRLGIAAIDLYYYHRIDPTVPIEETIGAMAELIAAGKVRYIGLSEAPADAIRRAQAVHPIAALQSEYSLFSRDVEDNGVLDAVRAFGITLVPYSPLNRGILSGTVRERSFSKGDPRARNPRFSEDNFATNLGIVDRFAALATEFGLSASQLALAWLYAQGTDIIPIPGTKRVAHLEENVAVAGVHLTGAQRDRLEATVPKGSASGTRHAASG
jgi:aryl-alcohol dehydrogenase-like predicted oxidoreductase